MSAIVGIDNDHADRILAELQHKLRTTLYAALKEMPDGRGWEPARIAAESVGFIIGLLFTKAQTETLLKQFVTGMAQQAAHKLECPADMRKTILASLDAAMVSENFLRRPKNKKGRRGAVLGNKISQPSGWRERRRQRLTH